jgi:hypothetical protein
MNKKKNSIIKTVFCDKIILFSHQMFWKLLGRISFRFKQQVFLGGQQNRILI